MYSEVNLLFESQSEKNNKKQLVLLNGCVYFIECVLIFSTVEKKNFDIFLVEQSSYIKIKLCKCSEMFAIIRK